jgi:hypothetical protein
MDELDEARTEVGVKGRTQGLVEATHGGSTRRAAALEAKEFSPTLAFWLGQQLGQALPAETFLPPKQAAEEQRDRVIRGLAGCIQMDLRQRDQLGAQRGKVDQQKRNIKSTQRGQLLTVGEQHPAGIGVPTLRAKVEWLGQSRGKVERQLVE